MLTHFLHRNLPEVSDLLKQVPFFGLVITQDGGDGRFVIEPEWQGPLFGALAVNRFEWWPWQDQLCVVNLSDCLQFESGRALVSSHMVMSTHDLWRQTAWSIDHASEEVSVERAERRVKS